MMKNNNKTISASEINKYTYCPYQWYYERLYGAKELRALHKKYNEEMGYTDSVKSNFKKGLDFHNQYQHRDHLKRRFSRMFFLCFLLIGMICGVLFYYRFIQ